MNVLQLISKRLYQGERVIAIVTFISMMLIMFIQVFFRYVVQSSLAWSEEAMRYLFVITSYFGAACATYEHKHVVIDFLGTICGKFVKGEKRQEAIFSAVDVLGKHSVLWILYLYEQRDVHLFPGPAGEESPFYRYAYSPMLCRLRGSGCHGYYVQSTTL